jgi:hypothetical protein
MIHSRPGFAPRTTDDVPAKLNADMIPAINRKPKDPAAPDAAALQTKADAAHTKKTTDDKAQAEAQALAAQIAKGPELLLNPTPSPPPQVLEPGK